jgi:hypothetical protein
MARFWPNPPREAKACLFLICSTDATSNKRRLSASPSVLGELGMYQKSWEKKARWFLKVDALLGVVVVAVFIAIVSMYSWRR